MKHLPKEEWAHAIEFLERKHPTGVKTHGSRVDVEETTDRELRVQLLKILRLRNLENYRVVSEPGQVEILPPKEEHERPKSDKRTTASPYSTMPYYFQDSTVIKPPHKKKD